MIHSTPGHCAYVCQTTVNLVWTDTCHRHSSQTAGPLSSVQAQRLHVRAAAPGPTENGDGAAPISKTQARLWLALVPLCWVRPGTW